MIAYDPTLPLVGLHVPKTAGTSLRVALERWFPQLRLHYRVDGLAPVRHALAGGDCVYGHFNSHGGLGALAFYPDARQHFCFLREPFDRFVSQWRFLAPYGNPADLGAFERWLRIRGETQRAGVNAHSFLWHFPAPPRPQPIVEAMRRSFVFVGLHERMQASMDALARRLGKEPVVAPRLNVTGAPTADFAAFRPLFETYFADEMEVYAAGFALNRDALGK